jgi:hypothetical protein
MVFTGGVADCLQVTRCRRACSMEVLRGHHGGGGGGLLYKVVWNPGSRGGRVKFLSQLALLKRIHKVAADLDK